MSQVHLTTSENIKVSSRFVSDKIDDKLIAPYIDEAEQFNIKPQIGESLFIDLLEYIISEDKSIFPDYSILLYGGIYSGCNGKKQLKGLIQTLNYYIWYRLVKYNNYVLTRKGTVTKTNQYSNDIEVKERLVLEKDALSIADTYLADCISYLETNSDKFPLFKRGIRRNRLEITIIGD